jgi:hypothetical protein
VPALSGSGFPEVVSSFDVLLRGAPADARTALLLRSSRMRWGAVELPFRLEHLGGARCALLVSGEVALAVQADNMGEAHMTIPIPPQGELFNAELYSQFLVADPAANALGYVTTNGGMARVGR